MLEEETIQTRVRERTKERLGLLLLSIIVTRCVFVRLFEWGKMYKRSGSNKCLNTTRSHSTQHCLVSDTVATTNTCYGAIAGSDALSASYGRRDVYMFTLIYSSITISLHLRSVNYCYD